MEGIEQTLRTRLTFTQAEQRIAGTDGLPGVGFDVQNLQQVALGARNIAAELALDHILDICNSVTDWSSESLSGGYVAQNPEFDRPQACRLLGRLGPALRHRQRWAPCIPGVVVRVAGYRG